MFVTFVVHQIRPLHVLAVGASVRELVGASVGAPVGASAGGSSSASVGEFVVTFAGEFVGASIGYAVATYGICRRHFGKNPGDGTYYPFPLIRIHTQGLKNRITNDNKT